MSHQSPLRVLIIGQGLSGTLLSWFLDQENIPHTVADPGLSSTASRTAAGIINPITGRKLVLSWQIESLLPFARKTYQQLESRLHKQFYFSHGLLALYQDQSQQAQWAARKSDPSYSSWIRSGDVPDTLNGPFGAVLLPDAGRVQIADLLDSWRCELKNRAMLLETQVAHSDISREADYIRYKGENYRCVVFCEGTSVATNPWFEHVPIRANFGQRLIIESPELKCLSIIRKHGLTTHVGPPTSNRYWAGATHEWDVRSPEPTQKGREYLESNLRRTLRVPFDIMEHQGAFRPTVKDRRPVLGFSKQHPMIGIFNGMGTKGASLAPWYAYQMAQFIAHRKAIHESVLLARFESV